MSNANPSASPSSGSTKVGFARALAGVGPAVVIAAVVLGPGSITTASKVGCRYGYSVGWVLVLATILMIGMTLASLVAGVNSSETAGEKLRERFGKPLTIILGLTVFLIVALFQSSNNRAMLLAAEVIMPEVASKKQMAGGLLLGFNFLVILFFLFSPNVYKVIERMMMVLVATMLMCFAINAFAGGLSVPGLLGGLVPSSESLSVVGGQLTGDLRGMIATTFSVAGAFYQFYLVRERGWTREELRVRWIDPVIGISTLGILTLLVMGTAAAALHQKVEPEQITDLSGLADSLRPTFGPLASVVFAAGILAGAISSFVGNALIGGTIFSDCLGAGASAKDKGARGLTILALLVGMGIALASILKDVDSVAFIIVAQGLTTLGLPLLAIVIFWMLWSTSPRRWGLLALVGLGIIVSCYVAAVTASSLLAKF